MLTAHTKLSCTPASKPSCFPILSLIPEKLSVEEEKDKSRYLEYTLKSKAGAPENSAKYKKFIRIFEEGTPQEWIELMMAVEEVWLQNTLTKEPDRVAVLQALIRGESRVTFDVALEEARGGAQGGAQETIDDTHITTALNAVATTIFPHRALQSQKHWMKRGVKKPYGMTTRKCAAALSRLNNALPKFPGGSEDSKFSESEILEILEYSLPEKFRAHFDSRLYVPSEHNRARLIVEAEAIERQQLMTDGPSFKGKKSAKKFEKSAAGKKGKTNYGSNKKFYCTEHGTNPTHATSDCFTLKNKGNGNQGNAKGTQATQRTWTKKSFRKELNLMARTKPKKEVLDMFASVITQQKNMLAKRTAKCKVAFEEEDSDSDSEVSLGQMERPIPRKKQFKKNQIPQERIDELVQEELKRISNLGKDETTEEEKAYGKIQMALQDFGGTITDKNQDNSSDSDNLDKD